MGAGLGLGIGIGMGLGMEDSVRHGAWPLGFAEGHGHRCTEEVDQRAVQHCGVVVYNSAGGPSLLPTNPESWTV